MRVCVCRRRCAKKAMARVLYQWELVDRAWPLALKLPVNPLVVGPGRLMAMAVGPGQRRHPLPLGLLVELQRTQPRGHRPLGPCLGVQQGGPGPGMRRPDGQDSATTWRMCRANITVLQNTNFCVGRFEFYVRKICATAPKIGRPYFIFSIFSFCRIQFCGPVFG